MERISTKLQKIGPVNSRRSVGFYILYGFAATERYQTGRTIQVQEEATVESAVTRSGQQ